LTPPPERRTPVRPDRDIHAIRADTVIGVPFSPCLRGGGGKLSPDRHRCQKRFLFSLMT